MQTGAEHERREKKSETKFNDACDSVRLKLIYADQVNDAGYALTKFYHEAQVAHSNQQARKEDAMLKFATSAGFFFYTSLEDQRLMRVHHLAGSAVDQNDEEHDLGCASSELRMASRGSFLFEEYELCSTY